MKSDYIRVIFKISEFDTEDVITTSGMLPTDPTDPTGDSEKENQYTDVGDFDGPGNWFG